MAEDINYFKRKRDELLNQIQRESNQIGKIEGEIKRLEYAYEQLSKLKHERVVHLENLVKLDKCAAGLRWRGHTKNEFDQTIEKVVCSEAKLFTRNFDNMLDDLNREIGEKRKQVSTGSWFIDSLRNAYVDICTTIQNFTN